MASGMADEPGEDQPKPGPSKPDAPPGGRPPPRDPFIPRPLFRFLPRSLLAYAWFRLRLRISRIGQRVRTSRYRTFDDLWDVGDIPSGDRLFKSDERPPDKSPTGDHTEPPKPSGPPKLPADQFKKESIADKLKDKE